MSDSRKDSSSKPSEPLDSTPDVLGTHQLGLTADLLQRVRSGDGDAREHLIERYLPILQRWARGRLPSSARSVSETDDLVQVTLIRALRRVESFEPRREGAFLSYLRQILLNTIREELRRSAKRPEETLPEEAPAEESRDRDDRTLELYEASLERLNERQREAAILRLEFGYTYPQIAEAIECPSADAARMIVNRALVQLASSMSGTRGPA